jgi:tRNA-splicing ligase RtcB
MTKPIKIYSDYIEGSALSQFYDAMKCDFAVQGALMPDAHMGYSLPIGAVVATKGVVVPAWVGYDIGCGMCALETNLKREQLLPHAEALSEAIYKAIPVGNASHKDERGYSLDGLTEASRAIAEKRGARKQLGTLGGGNHFIELGADEEDNVWIVIHSGSRGTGHGIAGHYMKIASGSNKAKEGHYGLDEDSFEGSQYIQDLEWCLHYALHNRRDMMDSVFNVLESTTGLRVDGVGSLINRNHNHAERKGDLWIHRKGATHAEEGMMGVIPGNMRDGAFIVRGKGDPESLFSSSHGAGRVLGRRKAKELLNVEDFTETMGGIVAKVGASTLDESPFAYKDIFRVMREQEDLVDVVAYVKPIVNIKG